jgi:predicted methyltransferase
VSNQPASSRPPLSLLLFLLSAIVILGGIYILDSTLNTLRTLHAVEAERDGWQRPGDILRALDLKDGNTVVDLGSGAGYFTLKISPAIGSRGRVLSVDIRKLSLTFLWLRSIARTPRNIHVILADEDDPHLPAASADALLIANTYHELHNPRLMIGYVFRSLRAGGRLVIVDRGPADTPPSSNIAPGHEVPMEAAEQELRHAGFEILQQEKPFIDRSGDDPWWMLTARKP